MDREKRNLCISGVLISAAIIFTVLVKTIDVRPIGVNGTNVGFAALNQCVFNITGVNIIWYHITDWLGILPVLSAFVYALIGLVQLVKRKSIFKVDKGILLLGMYYIALIGLYLFFEEVKINYRPILMNGFSEASYPSSHTLMAVCLCGGSLIINERLFKNNITKITDPTAAAVIIITVVGRILSGVHWFSDIVGGMIISAAMLMCLYSLLDIIYRDNICDGAQQSNKCFIKKG